MNKIAFLKALKFVLIPTIIIYLIISFIMKDLMIGINILLAETSNGMMARALSLVFELIFFFYMYHKEKEKLGKTELENSYQEWFNKLDENNFKIEESHYGDWTSNIALRYRDISQKYLNHNKQYYLRSYRINEDTILLNLKKQKED